MVAGVVVSAVAASTFLRWRPFRVEVRGDSMAPTLIAGDWALAVAPGTPRRGEVVVIEHPGRPGLEVVKRVTGIAGDLAPNGRILSRDELWVEGDNPGRSTDSRHYGPVDRRTVRARVRLVYWPASRRRILRPRR